MCDLVSLSTGYHSLRRRGYRQAMHKASLNESAAAGLLHLAGWHQLCRQEGAGAGVLSAEQRRMHTCLQPACNRTQPTRPSAALLPLSPLVPAVLADPMCGSGTFLIEAALMATDTAPGSFRRFWPFMQVGWGLGMVHLACPTLPCPSPFPVLFPDLPASPPTSLCCLSPLQWRDNFDREAWQAAVEAAAAARHSPPPGVECWGNDVHRGALTLALNDIQAAGMQPMVRLHHGECREWRLPRPPAVVVSNPPWGQRLSGERQQESEFAGGSGDVEEWWHDEAQASRQQRPDRRQQRDEAAASAALSETWCVGGRRRALSAACRLWSARWLDADADARPVLNIYITQTLCTYRWDLSAFLKQQCGGTRAFLLSGNPEATKGLRLKADRRYPVTVGGVDCRLLQYSIRGVEAAAAGPAAPAAGAAAAPDAS